ncbi:MAG: bifunctional methylenetetrahydrofolate dehydrogenase/methenyltetrahydrofolate cyclohydrolase FolD [SAR202 cluster bacterium]|nr:bifunctional methylenetetrahydrofolate dehydrogenase/methenyltetrahydrofolate cyclohydrolase FolD [Dehalococcoidia bacterium]MCS5665843.1 bifunctional methylenetetrahydrofolate dehydrogenase/methenyltetrahydrofolate cyclohydrolase FolD [Dehalococcoidia bacterium]MEE3167392.1 bifunctional methylenetetrahydrofolate dehydrogenase/methenyltetrahydrofolate cyclohydrolase FolD [Chloroflexota bacterium]MQG61927.1 bifunctional methylenetetrahydrofolate dehydrogenase/methenyltetrahydrofolate cyclohydr
MTAKILDGKALAEEIRGEVATGVAEMQQKHSVIPGLAAVLVGDDPASAIYVRNKRRACEEVGMVSDTFLMPADSTNEQVLARVQALNKDPRFHGILVQLPMPPQIDERLIIESLDPTKDVDGLHPFNVGKLAQGRADFVPGTPAGIQQILLRNGHDPAGANVVVCGRSDIVGKPMALLLMQRADGANATVTVCHTRTKNLAEITRQADILVAAIGLPSTITADMVKEGAVVIDVGINRVDDASQKRGYRLEGDVDFDAVSKKASAITPVPGGVGPMTIAMLLVNTLTATRLSIHGCGS